MNKTKVLVVDDDLEVGDLVEVTLENDGYSVVRAENGLKGLELARKERPSLIVSDVEMPVMDGLALCKELRADKDLHLVPVIMLTGSRTHPQDRITGLRIGADDYVLKPFFPEELSIRVGRLISRTEEHQSVNPLTKLPGSYTLESQVVERIEKKQPFAACYYDLDNFKAFNDHYGYKLGDEIIKFVASLLKDNFKSQGNETDVLIHVGGDDFILITSPDKVDPINNKILESFTAKVGDFYNEEDNKTGFISTKNRRGIVEKFPIMSLSIAVTSTENIEITHYAKMVDTLSDIKKFAKSKPGSVMVKDRRYEKEENDNNPKG